MNEPQPASLPVLLSQLRPLKWNEPVLRGDYVADGHLGFELWAGPSGFRADSFVKQIYRRLGRRTAKAKV
jgi:hypothetical protein